MKSFFTLISSQAYDGFLALNLDNDLPPRELESRVCFLRPWQYLEHQELVGIDAEAYRITEKCYCDNGVDITALDGISLGQLVEYEMLQYFVQSIKAIKLLLALRDHAEVGNVLLFGADTMLEKAALLLSKMGAFEATVIGQDHVMTERMVPHKLPDFRIQARQLFFRALAQSHVLLGRLFGREADTDRFAIESGDRSLPLIKKIIRERPTTVQIILLGNLKSAWWDCFRHARRVLITSEPEGCRSELQEHRTASMVPTLTEALKQRIRTSRMAYLIELVEEEIPLRVHQWLNHAVAMHDRAKRLLRECTGGTLTVIQDFKGMQRALVAQAKQMGMKTNTLQHGAYGFYPFFIAPISDVVTIWGPRWGAWFRKRMKVDQRRIVVANDCYYEKHGWQSGTSKVSNSTPLHGIPKGRWIVLFPHQDNPTISAFGFPMYHELLALDVCKAFRSEEDMWLILKLRPDDKVSTGIELAARAEARNVSVVAKADNLALLRSVDVVVARESTLAFEAALLGVPVVALHVRPYTLDQEHNPFIRGEFSVRVQGLDEAVKVTRRLLSDSEFRDDVLNRQKAMLRDYLVSEPTVVDVLRQSSEKAGESLRIRNY